MSSDIHKLLRRQIQKAGHPTLDAPPEPDSWKAILGKLNEHYASVDEDRRLLTSSLERSTREMTTINEKLRYEQDRLRSLVVALTDTLAKFREAVSSSDSTGFSHASQAVSSARDDFVTSLANLLNDMQQSAVFERMGHELSSLASNIEQLLAHGASGAELRQEIELAGVVQQLLVPESTEMERPFASLAASYWPAANCGGDWWGTTDLSRGRILLVVGDVTGHGVASAIMTGAAKAGFDLAVRLQADRLSPGSLLELMNVAIRSGARQRMLMTAVAILFEPEQKQLRFANAGHMFPLVARASEGRWSVSPLVAHGPPLGAVEAPSFTESVVPLQGNDVLLAATDGVVELANRRGEQFGERRLRSVLQQSATWDATGIRDAISHALRRHVSGEDPGLSDDVTFVVTKIG